MRVASPHLQLTSQAEKLHVIITTNRDGVTNALAVDSDQILSESGGSVTALGCVWRLGLRRLSIIPKDTGPLLDGLLVVRCCEGCVGTAVVDLHLGTRTIVFWVHILHHLGPVLCCSLRLAIGTGRVPPIHLSG